MAKYLRMVIVLTVTAMLSGVVLSQAYSVAIVRIEENREAELRRAVLHVLPGAETYQIIVPEAQTLVDEDDITLTEEPPTQQRIPTYRGYDAAGSEVGLAFIAQKPGYGGLIRIMVGMDIDQEEIISIRILEHRETPGLGARISEEGFRKQFMGKSLDDPFVVGNDVDNISGATVSAKAVSEAVKETGERIIQQER